RKLIKFSIIISIWNPIPSWPNLLNIKLQHHKLYAMSSKYSDLKQQCYKANMELNALNLVVYTFGNVSAVDRDNGVFAIKPSGVAYESLKPEDIVIVDFDNIIVEGEMRP